MGGEEPIPRITQPSHGREVYELPVHSASREDESSFRTYQLQSKALKLNAMKVNDNMA